MGGKKTKTKNSSLQTSNRPKRKSKPRRSNNESQPFNFQNAGGSIGKYVGSAAGSILGKIFGMGAYTVEQNALLSPSGTLGPPPVFQVTSDGNVIVCHREFVTAISGSTGFTMQLQQPINPANPNLFPRLAQLAPNFEEYEPLGLVFEFLTTSGTAVGSTNTALGVVMMATEYDVLSPPFSNSVDLEAYKFSTTTVPCSSALHAVECKPSQLAGNTRYIGDPSNYSRSATSTVSTRQGDARLYDLGLFQVATQGQQATNTVGQVWVSYAFRFKLGRRNPYASVLHITSNDNSATESVPMHGSLVSNASTMSTSLATNSFTLPTTGRYMITANWEGATITGSPILTGGANIVNVNSFNNYTEADAPGFQANRSHIDKVVYVIANGTGAANTITVSGNTTMTAANLDIYVLRTLETGSGIF